VFPLPPLLPGTISYGRKLFVGVMSRPLTGYHLSSRTTRTSIPSPLPFEAFQRAAGFSLELFSCLFPPSLTRLPTPSFQAWQLYSSLAITHFINFSKSASPFFPLGGTYHAVNESPPHEPPPCVFCPLFHFVNSAIRRLFWPRGTTFLLRLPVLPPGLFQ